MFVNVETVAAEMIAHLDDILKMKSESCKAEHAGTKWAVNYGLTCMQSSLEHLEATRAELEALAADAQPSTLPDAAE